MSTHTTTEREFIIVGQDTGVSYRLWDVQPAPTDPVKRTTALEEIGVEAMDALGDLHLEHATSARAAVDQLLTAMRKLSGLDDYALTADSNMEAYNAPAPAAAPAQEPYGRAETRSAARYAAYHVEASSVPGVPAFNIEGLPGRYLNETRDRVRAGVINSGSTWPMSNVLVKLTPQGPVSDTGGATGLDLAIACAVLAASDQIAEESMTGTAILGTLGLDGKVYGPRNLRDLVATLAESGTTTVIVPNDAVNEAAVPGVRLIGVGSLNEARAALAGHCHHPQDCRHCDKAATPHEPCTKANRCAACLHPADED